MLASWVVVGFLLFGFVLYFFLLQGVLARGFLDVSFQAFFRTTLMFAVGAVVSGVQNCQVAGLVPAFWHPGAILAPWGHPTQPWEQQGGLLGGVSFLLVCGGLWTTCWRLLCKVCFFGTRFYGFVFSLSVSACVPFFVWLVGLRCLVDIFPNIFARAGRGTEGI